MWRVDSVNDPGSKEEERMQRHRVGRLARCEHISQGLVLQPRLPATSAGDLDFKPLLLELRHTPGLVLQHRPRFFRDREITHPPLCTCASDMSGAAQRGCKTWMWFFAFLPVLAWSARSYAVGTFSSRFDPMKLNR